MADGTPIGALAVRISADISEFVNELSRADRAVDKFTRQLDRRFLDPLMKVMTAAAAAGAAISAFAKGAADAVDELGKMAQKIGMSVESLSALKYAAQLSDVSLDQLGTGLKQLSKFMVENRIQGVGVEEQLLRISDEFARTADNENKTAAAMQYFGKAGADLIPLLNQGRAGIAELRKEAERLGVVFSTEAAKRAEEFNDNLSRLTAQAQGLQVQLAGPLVEALNKTSQAMLEAKSRGESFFGTMLEGWRTLVTGDDATKWSVEFTKATDQLLDAQNKLDRLKSEGGQGLGAVKDLQAAQVELAKAQAELDRLRAIKPILAPDAPAGGTDRPRTGDVAAPRNADAMAKENEFIAKQFQEGLEEEQRIQLEAWAVMAELRAEELAREQEFRNERTRIILEAIDRETVAYEEQLRTEAQIMDERAKLEKLSRDEQFAHAQTFLANLASLMNTESRKAFEFGKGAAIAQASVKTALATIEAWEAGMSVGGPWAPIVAAGYAAAALATGLNYVNNIRRQSFGGGGGAPTPVGQGSSGVASAPAAAAPAAAAGGGSTQRIFNIHVQGSGRAVMEEFANGMNALADEGFVFKLAPAS